MSKELDYLDKILSYQPLTLVERTIIECIKEKIQRLEAIDNSNLSEALECLKHIKKYYISEPCSAKTYDCLETIKQALLKAQEPKKYLTWEDLEFNRKEAEYMKVSLNGTKYCLVLTWGFCEPKLVKVKPINLYEGKETDGQTIFLLDGNYINDKQFFNDLHLERVE